MDLARGGVCRPGFTARWRRDPDDDFFYDLIDEAVLNVDAARLCAAQISEEFLKRRALEDDVHPSKTAL